MGYWGHFLVARSTRRLTDLREVGIFGQPEDEQDLVAEWKLLRIAGNHPPDLQRALAPVVAATRAPALVAFVLDSDCAVINGQSQSGVRWAGVLNRGLATSYDGLLETYDTPDHGLSGAMRWAREAGLAPSEADVRDALNGNGTFVEDVIDRLLITLGILKMPNGS